MSSCLESGPSKRRRLFGGFNATLRDHARIGSVFLHGGKVGGKTILSSKWVDESLSPDPVADIVESSDGWVRRGKYQWFLTLDGRGAFAKGYHGQYIFLVPAKNMMFLRFGEGYGDVDWPALFLRLSDAQWSKMRHRMSLLAERFPRARLAPSWRSIAQRSRRPSLSPPRYRSPAVMRRRLRRRAKTSGPATRTVTGTASRPPPSCV